MRNKNKVFFILGIVFFIGNIFSVAAVLGDGLISYYSFDSDSSDSTGRYDGSDYGNVYAGSGLVGNSYVFDGSGDYVMVPYPHGFGFTDSTDHFSISVWAKTSSADNYDTIFGQGDTNDQWFSLSDTDGLMSFQIDDDVTKSVTYADSSTDDGTWHHYVVVRDGTNVYLYVDGSLDDSVTDNTGSIYNSGNDDFYIGARYFAGFRNDYYSGSIDELGIWGRALTSTEVSTLYNSGSGLAYSSVGYTDIDFVSPTTSSPINVEGGENVTLTFNFVENGFNITSGIDVEEVLIGGQAATIVSTGSVGELEQIDFEDFESGFGDWSQATFDTGDWTRGTSTPSGGTGPPSAYSGVFAYVETSSGTCNSPDTAVLYQSPEINFDSYSNVNINFAYNMYGSTMGTLNIKENSTGTWNTVWSMSGDQGTVWYTADVNFTGITGNGNVAIWMDCGASYTSDAAVDSINLTGTLLPGSGAEYKNSINNVFESFEEGTANYTHVAVKGTDPWHRSTESSDDGVYSWKFGDTGTGNYGNDVEAYIETPSMDLTDVFSFKHYMDSEDGWDGAKLLYEVDGSGVWNKVTNFIQGGYTGTTQSSTMTGFSNGEEMWEGIIGSSSAYSLVEVNNSGISGSTIKYRFYFASDAGSNSEGWYVDSVEAYDFVEPSWFLDITTPNGLVGLQDLEMTVSYAGSNFTDVENDSFLYPSVFTGFATILPPSAGIEEDLQGYCRGQDSESTQVRYYYRWYKDGVEYSSGYSGYYANSVDANVDNISSSVTSFADSWILSCLASSGSINGTWVNSSVNAVGFSLEPIWEPDTVYSFTDSFLSCNASSPTGTLSEYEYKVYKDGVVQYRGTFFKEGSISSRGYLSCGIRASDGRVMCWGEGSSGQQGDGSTTDNTIPALTSDASAYTQVAVSSSNVCGIRANDSRVLCWGAGSYVLGTGVLSTQPNPGLINDDSAYSKITVGGAACGIRANDSRVLCWGNGDYGQIGDGSYSDRQYPTSIVGYEEYIDISAGGTYTCGIRADGQVMCWGAGNNGRYLGSYEVDKPFPIPTGDSSKYSSISSSSYHTCGIRANDSRVLCWGNGDYGRLGDGSTAENVYPTLTSDDSAYKKVSTGTFHTCGIRANDSRVLCWGYNGYGQLGDGGSQESHVPILTTDTSEYLDVSAGNYHTCGVRKSDGRVLCWGRGESYALGDGSTSNNYGPSLTSDSSEFGSYFASGIPKGVSFVDSILTSVGESWTLSCRVKDSAGYSSWVNLTKTIIVDSLFGVDSFFDISNLYLFERGGLYCNGTSSSGKIDSYDYDVYRDGVVEYSGTLFKGGSISAGYHHTCGIRASDSRVLCWGLGSSGQIGDGYTASRTFPTLTSDDSAYKQVSASLDHTCGIRENDSRVLCWGRNYDGQLGIGSTDTEEHVVPELTADSSGYLQISSSSSFMCGIRENDSRVLCWGDNENGISGTGDNSTNYYVPTLTSDESAYSQIATGGANVCGIRADGQVMCWGGAGSGILGNGGSLESFVPVPTMDSSPYSDLSLGWSHACGIRTNDSRVLCWGYSYSGTAIASEYSSRDVPTLIENDTSAYSRISAGQSHTCGIRKNDSRVICWGRNDDGQLGRGSVDPSYSSNPELITNTDSYFDLSLGYAHSCGIRQSDGKMLCWGKNSNGQLGYDTSGVDQTSALEVFGSDSFILSFLSGVAQKILVLEKSSLFLGDNWTLSCGANVLSDVSYENDSRVVLNPLTSSAGINPISPSSSDDLNFTCSSTDYRSDIEASFEYRWYENSSLMEENSLFKEGSISAGKYSSCGIRQSDGRVLCWGVGTYGALGDGGTGYNTVPGLTRDSSEYLQVSVGDRFACGIRANDSRVLCWGFNDDGQLGIGSADTGNHLEPDLTVDTSAYSQISIGEGGSYACGIRANDSRVLCWGYNVFGQLGIGSSDSNPHPVPELIADSSAYSQISAGWYHTCGIRANDSRVLCWGHAYYYTLGNDDQLSVNVPTLTADTSAYKSVFTGYRHTCGIRESDSRALCWGEGDYGRLGTGDSLDAHVPTLIDDESPYAKLSLGYEYTCGIRGNDGQVLCWGKNDYGQLGVGNIDIRYSPSLIADSSIYTQISVGNYHTCGIRENDGQVLCWGDGAGYKLGTSSTSGSYSPTEISDSSPYGGSFFSDGSTAIFKTLSSTNTTKDYNYTVSCRATNGLITSSWDNYTVTVFGCPDVTSSGIKSFIVKNQTTECLRVDEEGDARLIGNLYANQGSLTPPAGAYTIDDSSGNTLMYVDDTCNMYLAGSYADSQTITYSAGGNFYVMRSSDSEYIFRIDPSGNFYTAGEFGWNCGTMI